MDRIKSTLFALATISAIATTCFADEHTSNAPGGRAVNKDVAACGLPQEEAKRTAVFLADQDMGGVEDFIKNVATVHANISSFGLMICYQMGQGIASARILGLIKAEDRKKADDICQKTGSFRTISQEDANTLKDIASSIRSDIERRFFNHDK